MLDALKMVCALLPSKNLDEKDFLRLSALVKEEIPSILCRYDFVHPLDVSGHVFQGKRADVPWLGFRDSRINSSPQTGIYVALLFRTDGSGFALSLQHGVENLNQRTTAKRTQEYRDLLPYPNATFVQTAIRLTPTDGATIWRSSSRPRKYEQANIVGKEYDLEDLPAEEEFLGDLKSLLAMYQVYAERGDEDRDERDYQAPGKPVRAAPIEQSPPSRRNVQPLPGTSHPPRDAAQGARALESASFKCAVDPTHETFQTPRHTPYVEKHHLIPMANRDDFELEVDHQQNIFALCPLCRRMIHHAETEIKVGVLEKLYRSRQPTYEREYKTQLSDILRFYGIGKSKSVSRKVNPVGN